MECHRYWCYGLENGSDSEGLQLQQVTFFECLLCGRCRANKYSFICFSLPSTMVGEGSVLRIVSNSRSYC